MVNKLSEDNFDRRVETCDIFWCMMDRVPHLADNTSVFHGLMKHNLIIRSTSTTIIWSPRNLNFAVNSDCQVPCHDMVWHSFHWHSGSYVHWWKSERREIFWFASSTRVFSLITICGSCKTSVLFIMPQQWGNYWITAPKTWNGRRGYVEMAARLSDITQYDFFVLVFLQANILYYRMYFNKLSKIRTHRPIAVA